ncbi:MAG: hypothetical protein ACRDFS_13785 [Chloroflexota bacterium]
MPRKPLHVPLRLIAGLVLLVPALMVGYASLHPGLTSAAGGKGWHSLAVVSDTGSTPVAGTTIYLRVTTTVDDDVADDCAGSDPCSLRAAIEIADSNSGVTNIYVPSGHYLLCGNDDDTGEGALHITGSGTVNINGASQRGVVIDASPAGCDFNHHAFDLGLTGNPTVTMRNLTLTGARKKTASLGGALYQNAGTLSMTSVTVTNNGTETNGGGMYLSPTGTDTLTAVTVTNNFAQNGGGIYLAGGALVINGGTYSNNTACSNTYDPTTFAITCAVVVPLAITTDLPSPSDFSTGGGIDIAPGATATITSATIKGNSAGSAACGGGSGGGIEDGGSLTLNRSTVSGNFAYFVLNLYRTGRGGGIRVNATSTYAEIDNSTISNNYAGYEGGGIFMGNTLTTSNDRIINNQAGGSPAGVTLITPDSIVADCGPSCNVPVAFYGAGGGIAGDHSSDVTPVGLYSLTDTASYISGNKAVPADNSWNGGECESFGGALYLGEDVSATLTQTHLISNDACTGGGSYQYVTSDGSPSTKVPQLTYTNSYVYQNQAGGNGGGMYVDGNDNCGVNYLALSYTRVVNNTAGAGPGTGHGGGIYSDGSSIQVNPLSFVTSNHPDNIVNTCTAG